MTPFALATTLFGPGPAGEREFADAASSGFTSIALDVAGAPEPVACVRLNDMAKAAGCEISLVSVTAESAGDWYRVAKDLDWPLLVVRAGSCGLQRGGGMSDLRTLRGVLESLTDTVLSGTRVALQAPGGRFATAEQIADLITSFDDPRLGACLDAGHAHLAGGAPEAADALSGLLFAVELHDNTGRDDSHRAPGEGAIDWPATLMACWKTGFTGPWVITMAADDRPSAALARAVGARTRLQAILEDLAQPIAFTE